MKTFSCHFARIFRLLLLAMFAFTLAACARTDPEKAWRASIAEMGAAVKARDTSKVMSHFAPDFARSSPGTSGGMNKDEARRTLAAVLLTNPNIYMNVTISDLKITGDSAAAKLVVVAGGGAGAIPERAQSWDFSTRWRFESGKWFLYSADWVELM
jgi:ketosteroid isomerase-like protein